MSMNVTEQKYTRVEVSVSEHEEQANAEQYLRSQYNLDDSTDLHWIVTSSFAPYTSELISREFSTSIEIKEKE